MPARKSASKPATSFEETLWNTVGKLCGSVESSDWSGATERTRQGCPEGERGGALSDRRWDCRTPRIFLKFGSDKSGELPAESFSEQRGEGSFFRFTPQMS